MMRFTLVMAREMLIALALLFLSIGTAMLTSCGGGTGAATKSPPPPSAKSQWTWEGGYDLPDQVGSYGTLGVAAAQNLPDPRESAVCWTDAQGNFWLFGGDSDLPQSGNQVLDDVWKYSDGQWTWEGGTQTFNSPGNYGTLGVASAQNLPPARASAASWTDQQGNLWIFGGGSTPTNDPVTGGTLNDLWRYSNGVWTWMGGPSTAQQSSTPRGIYGTQGQPLPTNLPGPRFGAASWTDTQGNLWMFGGSGYDAVGHNDLLGDLWKYSNGAWTWVSGANTIDSTRIYGTQGVAAPANTPGARYGATYWSDAQGNFWLFGGITVTDTTPNSRFGINSYVFLNDLWEYTQGQWVWVSGSSAANQPGSYGTKGVPAASNTPGARAESSVWVDSSGNFWLFGGGFNDLWRFANGQWTWMAGSSQGNPVGSYGTLGTPSPANVPPGRSSACAWVDTSGNLWLFGGAGYDPTQTYFGAFNDLWKYTP